MGFSNSRKNILCYAIYEVIILKNIIFNYLKRGGELFQHLKNSKCFTEARTKFYVAIIASAIGHLHSQDIIYRDLKPENILMDDYGYVYLTDFGMAKFLKKDTLAMTFCGTPEYLCNPILLL